MYTSFCKDCGYVGNDGLFWDAGGCCPKCKSKNIGGD
jgi:predicted Zn-ribbon and HTH transcriptional regulator